MFTNLNLFNPRSIQLPKLNLRVFGNIRLLENLKNFLPVKINLMLNLSKNFNWIFLLTNQSQRFFRTNSRHALRIKISPNQNRKRNKSVRINSKFIQNILIRNNLRRNINNPAYSLPFPSQSQILNQSLPSDDKRVIILRRNSPRFSVFN